MEKWYSIEARFASYEAAFSEAAMTDVYDYYYENYLMLHSLYGKGRPRMDRRRFEQLDRELLETVARIPDGSGDEEEGVFSREMFNRIREIEYLLLDDVSESLQDRRPAKKKEPLSTDTIKLAREEQDKAEEAEKRRPPALEFHWSDDAGALTP